MINTKLNFVINFEQLKHGTDCSHGTGKKSCLGYFLGTPARFNQILDSSVTTIDEWDPYGPVTRQTYEDASDARRTSHKSATDVN